MEKREDTDICSS